MSRTIALLRASFPNQPFPPDLYTKAAISRCFSISAQKHKRTQALQKRIDTSVGAATSPLDQVESSVARGTRYEHLCGAVLHQMFGMQLERTGGAGDRGIDLRGWWSPPASIPPPPSAAITEEPPLAERRIRIVAQCKCQDERGKKMGPALIREMEGVVFRQSGIREPMAGIDQEVPLAGIILSSSGFSKQALLQVRSSSVPLAAMHVLAQPQVEAERQGQGGAGDAEDLTERCISIVWNDLFGSPTQGLLDGGMEVRWIRSLPKRCDNVEAALGRPVIYRNGQPLR